MSKWIAEFDLEESDKMPEYMDLEYHGVKLDFHCRPIGKTYEDGLNEAWECVSKITCIPENGGLPPEALLEIFNDQRIYMIIKKFTPTEVIDKIKEYEEKQNKNKVEIHVGDEIYSELTNCKAVVQRIDSWNRYQCFNDGGAQFVIGTETFNDYWVKTGKNYPQIVEVLKQMQESNE